MISYVEFIVVGGFGIYARVHPPHTGSRSILWRMPHACSSPSFILYSHEGSHLWHCAALAVRLIALQLIRYLAANTIIIHDPSILRC